MTIRRTPFLPLLLALAAGATPHGTLRAQGTNVRQLARCTSLTGCNDSALVAASDSAGTTSQTRMRGLTLGEVRKTMARGAFDSLRVSGNLLSTAGQLQFGTAPPTGSALNVGGGYAGALTAFDSYLLLDGVDTLFRGYEARTYRNSMGAFKHASFRGKCYGGTRAAPAADSAGACVNFTGHSYDGTNTYGVGEFLVGLGQNQTTTKHGSYLAFLTTLNDSTNLAQRWKVDQTAAAFAPADSNRYDLGTAAARVLRVYANEDSLVQSVANRPLFRGAGYSLTGSDTTYAFNVTGTWNTSGVPTLFGMDVTNTASGVGSKLAEWKVSGSSVFSMQTNGVLSVSGSLVPGGSGSVVWSGRSRLTSPADGQWKCTNNASSSACSFLGTATNDTAVTGAVGEHQAHATAINTTLNLSTGAYTVVDSVTLTAGDWDCSGVGVFRDTAATTTQFRAAVDSVRAAAPSVITRMASMFTSFSGTAVDTVALPTPPFRMSVNGTQKMYLNVTAMFSTNKVYGSGGLRCRRMR